MTAITPQSEVTPAGEGNAVLPGRTLRRGDHMIYRSFAGDDHAARITGMRADGSVDLEVYIPGSHDMVTRTKVDVSVEGFKACARGDCYVPVNP